MKYLVNTLVVFLAGLIPLGIGLAIWTGKAVYLSLSLAGLIAFMAG